MFEAALASLRPRRRASIALSTGLHAFLCGALVLPPMLRLPELGVDPPENLPVLVTHLDETPKGDEPVKLPEHRVPPNGARDAGARGGDTTPKKYIATPTLAGVLPSPSSVATDDPCPGCEITLEPPRPPGPGPSDGIGGDPKGDGVSPRAIGPDVTPPVAVFTPSPDYPELMRRTGVEGTVILEAVIDREGRVSDVRVLRPANPLLDRAATETVLKWRYEPARVGTRPVAVYLTVTLNFRLNH